MKTAKLPKSEFMTQKMTIEADDERFDEIVKLAVKECKKVEPDCEVVVK